MSVLSIPGLIRGGQVEKFDDGQRMTFTVGAGQAATGGLLVESMAGDRVVRTAQLGGSLLVMGVAIHDAAAQAKVTVALEGVWMLISSGVIGAGNRVVADTTNAGQVKVAGVTPDARTIIGRNLSDSTDQTTTPIKLR